MPKAADGQYELVLENRQVLTIFFAVVVLCGVFFGLGYTVGKNTMGYIPPSESGVAAAATGKRSAIQPEAVGAPAEPAYDKLDEKASAPKLESAAAQPAARAAAPSAAPIAAPAAEGNISLQVAALSKKEDADALLSVLIRKGFRAYFESNSSDRLYRVQVGPFASIKEAEEAKSLLDREGFRAITKK